MLGVLTHQETNEVLEHLIVGRIGCHADGVTYIVPISYAYDGKYIYGHAREGMKVNMMRKNPAICFQADEMKDMANWKSVIAWGTFEELKEDETKNQALKILVNRVLPLISSETTHLSRHWPFPDENISGITGVVFRIKVEKCSGRYETNAVVKA